MNRRRTAQASTRRITALTLLLGILALAAPAGAAGEAARPRRIVSFNLCADQLVVALADPAQIAGLSPYAADPNLSIVADQARAFRRLDWEAESTVALAPDLVLVGPNDRTATRRMLTALGLRVVEVALVTDLAAARTQIREFAALVGHPDRGERLLAALDAARARVAAAPKFSLGTALVVERGGYAAGPASLAAALVSEAGLRPPPGAPSGIGGFVPLEQLMVMRPDLIVLKDPPERAADQGALFLTHPALHRLYPPGRRIVLPSLYTLCGGPALVAALNYLADVLPGLAGRR